MKDKTLINEVRKRLSQLESRYETIAKDLESTRGFLAMLEREAVNAAQSVGDRTHADIVADIVVEILSHSQAMHRGHILKAVLERGVHIGNDDSPQRQLAALSSIMSKDTRIEPLKGRSGFWSLVSPVDYEPPEDLMEAIDSTQEFHTLARMRSGEDIPREDGAVILYPGDDRYS